MKSFVNAMTENQHDHRSWRCTGLVAAFIILTLGLNASTREQAALVRQAVDDHSDNTVLFFTTAATIGQILTTLSLITADSPHAEWSKEALVVILFSHGGAVFLHDFLLCLGNAHYFVSVAFFQPMLALATLWAVTSVVNRPLTWLSTTVIGLGCTFMSVKSATVFDSDRTSLICILSSFSMILRNIVLHQLVKNENVEVNLRKPKVISAMILGAGVFMMTIYIVSSTLWLIPIFCVAITCTLSAALFYVTIQVLKSYGILFVSVFSIWALLVEAVVLTPFDHRPSWVMTVMALSLIGLGHYAFFKDHYESRENNSAGLIPSHVSKPVNMHEQYTRIEFLLFAAFVMGVIFYVFQPSLSERDINNLSYVGLDKVIRRLLAVREADGQNAA